MYDIMLYIKVENKAVVYIILSIREKYIDIQSESQGNN